MTFDKAAYRRQVFAQYVSKFTGYIRKVRPLDNGVYMQSLENGSWVEGVMPQANIDQWCEEMWGK